MSLPAIQSYGEPNCMYSVVALVRAGEDAGACMKVITYALAFFASLVLTLTLVGMIPLSMCVQEYARQSTEQALNNHTSTPPLTNAETTALRQELAKKKPKSLHLKQRPFQLQPLKMKSSQKLKLRLQHFAPSFSRKIEKLKIESQKPKKNSGK